MLPLLKRYGPYCVLALALAAALGGFFFLFRLLVGTMTGGPPDLLAPNPTAPDVTGIPSGAGFINIVTPLASAALAAVTLLLCSRWARDKDTKTARWIWAAGGVAAALLLALGIYSAVSGLLTQDVAYQNHQVLPSYIQPMGLVILAVCLLSIAAVAITRPRFLLVPVALWLAAALVFGMFQSKTLDGLNLFPRPGNLQASQGYTETVETYRKPAPASSEVKVAETGVTERTVVVEVPVACPLAEHPELTLISVSGRQLLLCLEDPNPWVREKAVGELGERRYLPALEPLVRVLAMDEAADVREKAAWALGELGMEEAAGPLTEAMLHDPHEGVRVAAAEGLGKLGLEESVEHLGTALREDSSDLVRAAAAEALGDLGFDAGWKPLFDAMFHDPSYPVRAASVAALEKLGDDGAAGPLAEALLNDSSTTVRTAAAYALGQMGGDGAAGPLAEALLNDSSTTVRKAAAAALGDRDDLQGVPALLEASQNDPNENVRATADEALENLGLEGIALENGGLAAASSETAGVPAVALTTGTTTGQAGKPSDIPVFKVTGASNTRYLRSATGEVYKDGRFTNLEFSYPSELAYQPPGSISSLVSQSELARQLKGELSSLISHYEAQPLDQHDDHISIAPVYPGNIPAGVVPTSRHLDSVKSPGFYQLVTATFRTDEPTPTLSWTSVVPSFSQAQLEGAAVSSGPLFIQLPEELPPGIGLLAEEITLGIDNPYLKAKAIEDHLRSNYTYAFADSPDDHPPAGRDPVDWFLFQSGEGTCGNFSSAFVLLARSVGLPARVVSGWAITPTAETQTVKTNQAHQWAEVLFEGVGWVTFEPTASGGAPSRVSDFDEPSGVGEQEGEPGPNIDPELVGALVNALGGTQADASLLQKFLESRHGGPQLDQEELDLLSEFLDDPNVYLSQIEAIFDAIQNNPDLNAENVTAVLDALGKDAPVTPDQLETLIPYLEGAALEDLDDLESILEQVGDRSGGGAGGSGAAEAILGIMLGQEEAKERVIDALSGGDNSLARDDALWTISTLLETGGPEAVAEFLSGASPEAVAAAAAALAGTGTSLISLENGGVVADDGSNLVSMAAGTTTAQASGASPIPVFKVTGASHTNYLRSSTGGVYQNGAWRAVNPLVIPYRRGTGITSALASNPELAELIRKDQSWTVGYTSTPQEIFSDRISLSPWSGAEIPYGRVPIAPHLESVSGNGEYLPLTAVFNLEKPVPTLTYTALATRFSRQQLEEATVVGESFYTQLPDDLPERIGQLAREITQGVESPYLKTKAIEGYLRSHYTYAFADSPDDRPPPGQDPVDWFLFESRQGTCGNFSSAFALLVRSVGLPARVVSGWAITATPGEQVVAANQAHQWAEVAFSGLGWVTFEPTTSGPPQRAPDRSQTGQLLPTIGGRNPVEPVTLATTTAITRWPDRMRKGFPIIVGGVVSSPTGVTVDDMEVEIFINETKEQGGTKVGHGRTRNGRFQVEITVPPDFDPGGYQLIAHAITNSGFDQSWSDPEIAVYSGTGIQFIGPSELAVDVPATYRGRLTEENGAPLGGQAVSIAAGDEILPQVVTDFSGGFSFNHTFVDAGQRQVTVEFPENEFLLASSANISVAVTTPTEIVLDVSQRALLGEEFEVNGRLRDSRGGPLGGQTVRISLDGGEIQPVTTGPSGEFQGTVMTNEAGTRTVTASYGGDGGFTEPSSQKLLLRVEAPAFLKVSGEKFARVGAPYQLTGSLTGKGGAPLGGQPLTVVVDGVEQPGIETATDGTFTWEHIFTAATDAPVQVGFGGTEELASAEAYWPLTVDAPLIVLEPPEAVARGETAPLRGVVAVGSHLMPGVELTVDGAATVQTNPAGAFLHRYAVPADAPLGVQQVTVAAPNLEAETSVELRVKSATSIIAVPLEKVKPGKEFVLEVRLLDDRGAGIPGAVINTGGGLSATTDANGAARFTLQVPDDDNLTAVPVSFRFAGDDTHMPLIYSLGVPMTITSFNWLWVVLPLAVLAAGGGAYWGGYRRLGLGAQVESAAPVVQPPVTPTASPEQDMGPEEDNVSVEPAPEPVPTRLDLSLTRPGPDLPPVWGVGEEVPCVAVVSGEDGQGLSQLAVELGLAGTEPLKAVTDADGRAEGNGTARELGEHQATAAFAGNDDYLPSSARASFRVVDFREEVVRLYNDFLDWVGPRVAGLTPDSTPREMEAQTVGSGLAINQRALEELISRFEQAEYSTHDIERRQYESMYRAWRALAGEDSRP